MKKGFTLIELLAVIIILAIIAIIATPIITDVIESSKESANLRSIEGYAKAVKQEYYNESLGGAKPTIDSTFLSNIDTGGGEVKCDSVLYNNGTILYKCSVQNSEKKYCYANEQHYACDDPEFLDIFKGSGGVETLDGTPIGEIVLSNFPYLATNGNGCVTPNDINYSYMGGCYLKGSSQSGKDVFYSTLNESGIDNDTITQTFFDSEGNFVAENFENWYRNFMKEQGLTDEQIDQMLQESGKNTAFEAIFDVTSEELFAQKGFNNSLWYSGFLWRIMGINADGSIRLITDENVTSIPYHESSSNWDESYAKDWLNNYFYSRLKGNNIIKKVTWCSETTTDKLSARTTCTDNLSKEKSKVGLMTLDEYNLAGGGSSYLNIGQWQWTMTPKSSSDAWEMIINGGALGSSGLRAVINVNSDATITGGNGTLGETWSNQTGPYILNEDKSIEVTGKLNEKATSGEYVLFAGKKYRVVDKDSNGNTKLILDGYYEENGSIFEMKYNETDTNVFSTTTGIGKKLYGDVLNWLTNNNDTEKGKLVSDYTWYQNNFGYGIGEDYKISLNEESPTRSIQATVGLIRVGEMLSGQSSSILTKGYTTTSSYNNVTTYWTMTPYTSSSLAWAVNANGDAHFHSVSKTNGLRAVIVVTADVTITGGNGTWSSPYEI